MFSIRNFFISLFVMAFLLTANFEVHAWTFGGKKGEEKKPAQATSVADKTVSRMGRGKDGAGAGGADGAGPFKKFSRHTAGVPAVNAPAIVPAAVHGNPEIIDIQKQISDIIKINESLKSHYASQAAEIQKISEQAKIHQKILRDLQTIPKPEAVNSEGYLNREKVRLIQRETEKNQEFIRGLKTQDISRKSQKS